MVKNPEARDHRKGRPEHVDAAAGHTGHKNRLFVLSHFLNYKQQHKGFSILMQLQLFGLHSVKTH